MNSNLIQNYEIVGDKAVQTYPCRCGETHRGDYALEDYLHHNCFHRDAPLSILADDMVMCIECGETFYLKQESAGPS